MYSNTRVNRPGRDAALLNIFGEVVPTPVVNVRGRSSLYNGRFTDYELHTVWLSEKPLDYRNAVYSDRLLFDSGRYERLARLHFGDVSHLWNKRTPAAIEAFLTDYFMYPEGCLKLTKVTKERNRANGQHLWVLYYTYECPVDFCLLH